MSTTAAARFWLTITKLGVYSIRRESYDAAVRAAALYRELDDDQRWFEALTFAAVQGTRFATVAEMEAQIEEAARLERPEWPARQRAKLQFARCFWFARQGRIDEALACAQRQVAICRDAASKSPRCSRRPTSPSWRCCSVARVKRWSTRAPPLPACMRSTPTPAPVISTSTR